MISTGRLKEASSVGPRRYDRGMCWTVSVIKHSHVPPSWNGCPAPPFNLPTWRRKLTRLPDFPSSLALLLARENEKIILRPYTPGGDTTKEKSTLRWTCEWTVKANIQL